MLAGKAAVDTNQVLLQRLQPQGFAVVQSPPGVTVSYLPPGATTVYLGGRLVYQVDGVYFEPEIQGGVTVYTVVPS
jgi:hypothetical protein